mgnify:CR=1 FL=1
MELELHYRHTDIIRESGIVRWNITIRWQNLWVNLSNGQIEIDAKYGGDLKNGQRRLMMGRACCCRYETKIYRFP